MLMLFLLIKVKHCEFCILFALTSWLKTQRSKWLRIVKATFDIGEGVSEIGLCGGVAKR